MNKHVCKAIIVSCMDFRLSDYLKHWTEKKFRKEGYDRLAIAGAVKNLPFVVEQVELSISLHGTKEAYLINHEDCGAYGKAGNYQRHKKDLLFARDILKQRFPKLKIHLLYLRLNGEFKTIK